MKYSPLDLYWQVCKGHLLLTIAERTKNDQENEIQIVNTDKT